MTPWEIQGTELMNCNCSYGCPCQFNALPTNGHCQAMGAISIDSVHYGDVVLDGVRIAVVFKWPGAVHEGHGKCQPIVDERADPAQCDAVLKIMTGQDTDPFATMFSVFASTLEQAFDPIFAKIDFDVDVDARRGQIHVDGVLDVVGEPIVNPVTGAEHRVRIDLPGGFEYELAEIGSGTGNSHGHIELDFERTYAQFARLHLNNHGVVRHRAMA